MPDHPMSADPDTLPLDGFDAAEIAAIQAQYRCELQSIAEARAIRRQSRHALRRAKAERHLAEILPARFEPGESWHVLNHGDIDALSYLRHALAGTSHFDFVLVSTCCIATEDMKELHGWLDTGRIDALTICAGEIFPSQYPDEYAMALRLAESYGVRLIVARNHSKVILAEHAADGLHLVLEGSANVNTNPRIEQTAIHNDAALLAFYRDFYHALRSIDSKRPALAAA